MSDELLDHWREYGVPKRQCSYDKQDNGSVRIENMDGACCLSDFSNLDFYRTPKDPPKLSGWRWHNPPPPPKPKPKIEPWRK